jgi:hypothetical protein
MYDRKEHSELSNAAAKNIIFDHAPDLLCAVLLPERSFLAFFFICVKVSRMQFFLFLGQSLTS